jgi:lipopolysaccharide/colanic/teichoic acid biosynthesis glycosyltransferase
VVSISKIPRDEIVKGAEVSFSYPTTQRPLQLLAGYAIAISIGLICATALAAFLHNALKSQPAILEVATVILAVVIIFLSGTAAVTAMSEHRSQSRLLHALTCSFLVHYIWLTVAFSTNQSIAIDLLPASFATVLVFSLVIEFLWNLVRPQRIGVIGYGLSPEYRNRLGSDVQLVTGPSTEATQKYDLLLVDFSVPLPPEWTQFMSRSALMGCEVRHISSYAVQRTAYLSAEDVEPDFILRKCRGRSAYFIFKRLLDVAIVLCMAPIVIPIITFAVMAILVSMGRPAIFVQERVGSGGRIFLMYKLRTMSIQKPNGKQSATASGDVRITPVGKILRRFRIDELPQLLNVLKGDMSLIGPRPEQPQLVEKYRQSIPYYDLRHAVQPGLSGWAQVNFGYASTLEETRAKTSYDLFYIKEVSLALDVEIALATVWVILRGWNAR